MKVHLKALGCRLNEAELENWSQTLLRQGMALSPDAEDADLIIINTCAVTSDASRKSRNLINRFHRQNPDARLVVTGCHASLTPEKTAATLGVDLVVANGQKQQLPELLRNALDLPPAPGAGHRRIALRERGRHRAFIKIQDGCRYRCSFCIVTVARGDERSVAEADIIEQINRFAAQGIQEAVLTGVHVGGYGSDTGSSLTRLVQRILAETDIPRLRFASVEPWDLPNDFFALFRDPRLMPHIHLPLQSGSDSVLRRMSRRCKTDDFRRLVDRAREQVDGINITTDIIAGFPGETDQEWRETTRFVESIGFGHLHIFPYSPREGTKAARMPNPVDKATRQARCKELAELGHAMKRRAMRGLIGSTQAILWEQPETTEDGHIVHHGYTPNFLRVRTQATGSTDLESRIAEARMEAVDDRVPVLLAEPVAP
ncbi:MAG TPA: tRNA (N(6)-L-threonylcarbamoyladenosine(37)-C(2))-methylthiotransferase MtaB [Gammaproteobacteria bacterium]|nr:tRNA (N(6)-L-threonylcarbamoyladenosine(37)-C(2))-methylthiotransferase MtaB [Gammaproteobacteria bacterium]